MAYWGTRTLKVPRLPELTGVVLEGVKVGSEPQGRQHQIVPVYAPQITVTIKEPDPCSRLRQLGGSAAVEQNGAPFLYVTANISEAGKTRVGLHPHRRSLRPAWAELRIII